MTSIATRLRLAREAAGFSTAADAADRFGWNYATYAGHENGSRGLRTDVIRRYAAAFHVEASWLIDGSGGARRSEPIHFNEPARRALTGFEEPAISPYRPNTPADGRGIDAIVSTMAVGWRHIETWIANRDWHPYAILRGDIIIIGTPPAGSRVDIVIANWADPDSLTTLAQRSGEALILPPGEPVPQGEPGVLGAVAMVVRPPNRKA